MAEYSFVTGWEIKAPLKEVWEAVFHSEKWPSWWRGVESVVELRGGDALRQGSLYRFTWKSKLPYRLVFDMETTRVEPMTLIEGLARGELAGRGVWRFFPEKEKTRLRYDWKVRTTKRWMNLVAPLARPIFEWNHDVVMHWGEEGLKRLLEI